jgi:hypothetical protein
MAVLLWALRILNVAIVALGVLWAYSVARRSP